MTTPAEVIEQRNGVAASLEVTIGRLADAIGRMSPDRPPSELELSRAIQPVILPAVAFAVTAGVIQPSLAAQTLLGPEDGQVWHLGRVTLAGLTGPLQGASTTTSGQQTSPGAAATITSQALAAGTYVVQWTVVLSGTLGAGDANNLQLTNGATQVAVSLNAGAAGTYIQQTATVVVPAGGATVAVKSIAAATVGGTYAAQMTTTATPGTTGDQASLYRETVGLGGQVQNKLRTFTGAPPNDVWEPARVFIRSPEALTLVGSGLLASTVTLSGEAIAIDARFLARYLL
jgi:hypothetical protein